jgi:hypothetical protein
VLIDALGEVGGQCTALYPEKPIYDIPAYPRDRRASELVRKAAEQAAPFSPPLPSRPGGDCVSKLAGECGRVPAQAPPRPRRHDPRQGW